VSNSGRLQLISQAVRSAGRANISELTELTGASEMTVRRDLDALAAQGVLERFRGGARSLLLRGVEPPFALRALDGGKAKQRIAAAVANLIADGESVVLDSGTTCAEVARSLHQRRVTVMPLSLQAINALAAPAAVATLLVPGGRPRTGEGALVGPLARASLETLRFDTAVIGCCGIDAADGITAYDLDDADIKRAAIARARRVIVVTDGAKFGRTSMAATAPVSAIHALITDETAPQDQVHALTAAGVAVHVVRSAAHSPISGEPAARASEKEIRYGER
jgi:DeoR/GlpR family transcriptional regulator of sugar metabolism